MTGYKTVFPDITLKDLMVMYDEYTEKFGEPPNFPLWGLRNNTPELDRAINYVGHALLGYNDAPITPELINPDNTYDPVVDADILL